VSRLVFIERLSLFSLHTNSKGGNKNHIPQTAHFVGTQCFYDSIFINLSIMQIEREARPIKSV
jgi:hypothetical protein